MLCILFIYQCLNTLIRIGWCQFLLIELVLVAILCLVLVLLV